MQPIIVPQLPLETWEEFKPLFAQRFPNETVIRIDGNEWTHLHNASRMGAFEFQLTPQDAIELFNNPPDLLLHSHPSPPASAAASDHDIAMQLKTNCNWGIVEVKGNIAGDVYDVCYPECWGPTIPQQPLLGRQYLFGVRDCVSICWDYYEQHGAPLTRLAYVADPMMYPTTDDRNRQFELFPKLAGLKPVARHDRRPGDFAVMQVHDANRDNHCAVYLGEGKFLHQGEKTLSCEWRPYAGDEERFIERHNVRFYRNPKLKLTS